MSASSFYAGVALAASAVFGPVSAQADTITLNPIAPSVFAGSFQHMADGFIFDTFDFVPTTFAGVVSVTLTSIAGPVALFTATLNGINFSYFPELGDPDFSFSTLVTADTPLSLFVFGSVFDADGNPGTGLYGGSVSASTITAVPEPQTWALLFAGLGAVGLASARRRRAGRSEATLSA